MNITVELASALQALIPWAGPIATATPQRLAAIRAAQEALDKAHAITMAQKLRENYGL